MESIGRKSAQLQRAWSHTEVTIAAEQAAKETILTDNAVITTCLLVGALQSRRSARAKPFRLMRTLNRLHITIPFAGVAETVLAGVEWARRSVTTLTR